MKIFFSNSSHKAYLVVFIVFLFIAGSFWIFQQRREFPLASQLSSEKLVQLISALEKQKISFRVDLEKRIVFIPIYQELKARKVFSKLKNKSSEGQGLEIFDKPYFGLVSSYVQKVKYQKALQVELTRTLNRLDFVKSSKVILLLPRKKGFWRKDQEDPSASVILDFSSPRVTPKQIQTVVFLISSTVENLKPNNVMVLNSDGDILSSTNKDYKDSLSHLNSQWKEKNTQALLIEKNKQEKRAEVQVAHLMPPQDQALSYSHWLFLLTLILLLGGVFFIRHRRSSSVESIVHVLPRTVEELEEWHSEVFELKKSNSPKYESKTKSV